MIKKSLFGLMVLLTLSGCASGPKYTIEDMNDPWKTPPEKWSDAMVVAQAMKLGGVYDMPKKLIEEATALNASTTGNSTDFVTAGTGVIAGAPSADMGVALAGAGFVLDMMTDKTGMVTQIAAWVPRDQASTLEEAHAVAKRAFDDARMAMTDGNAKPWDVRTLIGPRTRIHNRKLAGELAQKEDVRPPLLKEPKPSIGPIFVDEDLTSEFDKKYLGTDRTHVWAQKLSANLPEWFFVYAAGRNWRKDKFPPAIYNQGKQYLFIEK